MNRLWSVVLVVACLGVARAQTPEQQPSATHPSAGGVTWTMPAGWEAQEARPRRVGTWRIAPAKGDAEPADLAIFYFGPGQGGGVEDNVKRWMGQFQKSDGKPLQDKDLRTRKETLGGLPVTFVDTKGTYLGGGPMMGPSIPKPGWRLLGAIVEGPQGPVFFKLTGPERTVASADKPFRKMLESLKTQ
jgi:hypothetical protein